jgi:hypothetical protein
MLERPIGFTVSVPINLNLRAPGRLCQANRNGNPRVRATGESARGNLGRSRINNRAAELILEREWGPDKCPLSNYGNIGQGHVTSCVQPGLEAVEARWSNGNEHSGVPTCASPRLPRHSLFPEKTAPTGTIRNIAHWCDGSFETRKGFQQ